MDSRERADGSTMRFLAFLDGANGVRGFVVANLDGEILAEKGARSGLDWAPSRIVCVAQDLAVAGALVGLGAFSGAALKSAKSSRLIAHRHTHGPALAISKGLDRDRAVDESGDQVSIFNRIGSRPMTLEEMQRLYLKNGAIYTVSEAPK